jgi:hypothetical protein
MDEQKDLRNDQPQQKKYHHKANIRVDRDKRDFKDTHNVKKSGGGAHNWGTLKDEVEDVEQDVNSAE